MTVDIRRSSLASPDAVRLISELNTELTATFPEPGATHFSLSHEQVAEGDGAFVIVYVDGDAVGCGAIRRLDGERAEIKRMFVSPPYRGRGLGRAIVGALEGEARRLGFSHVVLETGTRLPVAIALYESAGYARIPLFGEYTGSPETSICFGKAL
jgi:putative acetyltransferase